MQQSYWEARWRKRKTGFHRADVNPALVNHWDALRISSGNTVAVPFCGKAVDMVWLRDRGYEVIGIEFVEQACREFFEEHTTTKPDVRKSKRGLVFSGEAITLHCADLFKLTPSDTGPARALYDRASLVAIPPEIRPRYVEKLGELFPDVREQLLISFEYDTDIMQGPPFSVEETEIRALYEADFCVTLLSEKDLLPESEKYRRIGLPEMIQKVWRISRK